MQVEGVQVKKYQDGVLAVTNNAKLSERGMSITLHFDFVPDALREAYRDAALGGRYVSIDTHFLEVRLFTDGGATPDGQPTESGQIAIPADTYHHVGSGPWTGER